MTALKLRRFAPTSLLLFAAACSESAPTVVAPPADGLASDVQDPAAERAAGKDAARDGVSDFVAIEWHDGVRERTAWLEPGRLVDHAPDADSRARVLALDPQAQAAEAAEGAPRIWKLGAARKDDARALCDELSAGAGRFSPLFRDTPSASAPARSLPGGVLVSFQADWDAARAEAWLGQRALQITQRVALATPTFVVASPPGLPALELAKELRAAPELSLAQPDWWVAAAPY